MWNLVIDNYWNNEDIQIIIERSRKIVLDDATLTIATNQLQATVKHQMGVDPTAYNAGLLAVRKTQIKTLQLTAKFLKLQLAILKHKIDFPVQTTETAIATFKTTADTTNTITWNLDITSTNAMSIYSYNLSVEDVTANFLTPQNIIDVLNLADGLAAAAGAATKVALTPSELITIAVLNQATFDALTAAARRVHAGPLALARFKSKAANKNPNRTYAPSVLLAYGLTTAQLSYSKWSANEPQYVLYLASKIPLPVKPDQITPVTADYALTTTAKKIEGKTSTSTFPTDVNR